MPLWKDTFPRPKPKRLACPALMGGALAMRSCLSLDFETRPSAAEIPQQMKFWAPSRFELLDLDGRREFIGKRGRFSILLGELSPHVLARLQQDAEAIKQMALHASKPGDDSFQEEDAKGLVKAEKFGKLANDAPATLNGKKILEKLPPRICEFVSAFKLVNSTLFQNLDCVLRRSITLRSRTEKPDQNAEHFLREKSCSWWGSTGSIQVMRPTDRADNKHIDGGAGILHAAVSIFGERPGGITTLVLGQLCLPRVRVGFGRALRDCGSTWAHIAGMATQTRYYMWLAFCRRSSLVSVLFVLWKNKSEARTL